MSISISGSGGITGATTSYSFDQSVSIGGTLTYEDVTNIDSVGIITAQSGIKVPGGSVAIGLDTTQALLHVKSSVARASIVESTSTDGSYTSFVDPSTSSYDRVQIGSAGNDLVLRTTEVERMRIDSSGNVGIGTDNPEYVFDTRGSINISGSIFRRGADNATFSLVNRAAQPLTFGTNDTERMRIDSSGRVTLKNGGSNNASEFQSAANQFVITNNGACGLTIDATSSTNCSIHFADGASGDESYRGFFVYNNADDSLRIGTAGAERMRIESSGNIFANKTANNRTDNGLLLIAGGSDDCTLIVTNERTSGGNPIEVNRQGSDGNLISFFQAGTLEGAIVVSGSTVSLSGGHLSRWSQLAGGAERTEILRGTVLSNLDEMCEWGEEDNEQLNRMKVSDVEGDANVAGVFMSWDDDDIYPNDFYCAMTGDFVIRIAQGTTVARGDLLMSAGDGTAKPQDDDIVRSKTIAKVTSTTVSQTYSDGSYCVPCVLMAC